jgi:hypothetical protein
MTKPPSSTTTLKDGVANVPEPLPTPPLQLPNPPPTTMGLRVVIGFFYFHLLLVLLPAWSYFQYDMVAAFHLEEPRSIADEAVVQTNRAIGLVNLMLVVPLNLLAIIGLTLPLLRRRRHPASFSSTWHPPQAPPLWGMISSYLLLGVALYWPTLFVATRITYAVADIAHVRLGPQDLTTVSMVLAFALWSTWHLSTLSTSLGEVAPHDHDDGGHAKASVVTSTTNHNGTAAAGQEGIARVTQPENIAPIGVESGIGEKKCCGSSMYGSITMPH